MTECDGVCRCSGLSFDCGCCELSSILWGKVRDVWVLIIVFGNLLENVNMKLLIQGLIISCSCVHLSSGWSRNGVSLCVWSFGWASRAGTMPVIVPIVRSVSFEVS